MYISCEFGLNVMCKGAKIIIYLSYFYLVLKSKQPMAISRSQSTSSSLQFSPPATIPRVPTEDFMPYERYELCDLTPAELAAVELLKKRGPRPNPPVGPYKKSHTLDSRAGEYGVLRGDPNDKYFKSSLESSLKASLEWLSLHDSESKPPPLGPKPPPLGPKPPTMGPKPSVKQKPAVSPKPVRELKPPPRKKYNITHKTKAEQPT